MLPSSSNNFQQELVETLWLIHFSFSVFRLANVDTQKIKWKSLEQ